MRTPHLTDAIAAAASAALPLAFSTAPSAAELNFAPRRTPFQQCGARLSLQRVDPVTPPHVTLSLLPALPLLRQPGLEWTFDSCAGGRASLMVQICDPSRRHHRQQDVH